MLIIVRNTSRIMRKHPSDLLPDMKEVSETSLVDKKDRRREDKKSSRRSKTKLNLEKISLMPVTCEDNTDNIIGQRYVYLLVATLGVNIIAIFWSMLALWNPKQRYKWYDNWQTRTSKWIITFTCLTMATLVLLIRKLDLKQLAGGLRRRYNMFIALEALLVFIHVPPVSFGEFDEKVDLYNIYGIFKLYLLFELFKIKHPLWLRRYEVASSQANVSGPPVFVGNFFCVSCLSLDYDLTSVFLYVACAIISVCTITIYFMERWGSNFDISNAMDDIFSGMVHVPRACHLPYSCGGYVSTRTYGGIKVFIGAVYFFNRALLGWTFGFRLAENSETVDDLLNDVKDYIRYRHSMAQLIQKWWREQRENRLSGRRKECHVNWRRALVVMRERSIKNTITKADLMVEMEKTWKDVLALRETNKKLVKSNQELKRLLLVFLKRASVNKRCGSSAVTLNH